MNKSFFLKFFSILVLSALIFSAVGVVTAAPARVYSRAYLCPDGSIVFGTTTCPPYPPPPPPAPSLPAILHVKPDNETNANTNCDSWANSCTLQKALQYVNDNQGSGSYSPQIRVKAGTYRPTHGLDNTHTDRTLSFELKAWHQLYGGFNGTEPGTDAGFDARNPNLNETILGGDIGVQGNQFDNSMHVVKIYNPSGMPALSGFTIRDGYTSIADGLVDPFAGYGAGMVIWHGRALLAQLKITGNYAAYGGGIAWYEPDGFDPAKTVELSQVDFIDNFAILYGGGLFTYGSNFYLTASTFTGNSVGSNIVMYQTPAGGAMALVGGGMQGTNLTITGNHAPGAALAGGIWAGSVGGPGSLTSWFSNSVMAENEGGNCMQNAVTDFDTSSKYNFIDDTNSCGLVDGVNGNQVGHPYVPVALSTRAALSIAAAGSGIDQGNNATCPPIDQDKRPRPYGGKCDIGAREYSPVYYVASGGRTSGSCDTWKRACDLQYALTTAQPGTALWVKAGTYKPHASDRSASFVLKDGVPVYGGFAGTETLLGQRNPGARLSILSGDIGTAGDPADNSYHVVVGSNTDSSAVLDGFTITGGQGDGVYGGGMTISAGSPTLANLTFQGNYAAAGGGLYLVNSSSPSISRTTFSGNTAVEGAGAYFNGSTPVLSNVTFTGNIASANGGALTNYLSSPQLLNVTISGNSAPAGTGGAMLNVGSSPVIRNSILWADGSEEIVQSDGSITISDSIVQGASGGVDCLPGGISTCSNVLSADPLLGPLAANGGAAKTMALLPGSPAIDAGDSTTCADADTVNNVDQRGFGRPQDGNDDTVRACDIGAFEVLLTAAFTSKGSQDGWILESGETTNTGGALDVPSTTLRLGDDASNRQYRSLVSFVTGSLPDDAVPATVTLRLRKQGVAGGGNPVTIFKGFSVDAKQGPFGTAALALGDFNARATHLNVLPTPVLTGGWYELNLNAVASRVNVLSTGGGLTQVRVQFILDDNNNAVANFLSVFSAEAGAARAPQLIVTYYLP